MNRRQFSLTAGGAGRFCPKTMTGLPQNVSVSSGVALRTGIVTSLSCYL